MSENHEVEYKRSWRDDQLKWICGFANAQGGVLWIGRADDGKVVGLDDAARLMGELPNKIRDLLGVMVDVNLHTKGRREYLEVRVAAYPSPISYRGEYYYRSGSTNQLLKGAALDRFMLRKHGRTWDSVPAPGVSASDLDPAALKSFRQQALKSGRLPESILGESNWGLLEKLRLTEKHYLTCAAVLVFHPYPQRFFGGSSVKIGYFESNTDLRYQDEVEGSLLFQVERTIEILQAKYLRAWITYEGIHRVETYPMPIPALREAVVNAIVHKDYASGIPIQISVYRDKLMIWNPGELPPEWTLDKLLGKHPSIPYNPDVARTFFRTGTIEAWGRGIERIQDACRAAGAPEPEITVEATGLWTVFRYLPEHSQASSPGQVTGQVTGQVAGEVTGEVARLLLAVDGEQSRSALQIRLGLRSRANFLLMYMEPALEAGLIELTIPDKPQSRLQRYRLTGKGRVAHAALSQTSFPEQVTEQVEGQVTGQVAGEVTGEVAKLLLVVDGEQPRSALQRLLGLRGRTNFLRMYMEPALEAALLEMTIPDKPQSRLQRYRLTEKGRAAQAALRRRTAP